MTARNGRRVRTAGIRLFGLVAAASATLVLSGCIGHDSYLNRGRSSIGPSVFAAAGAPSAPPARTFLVAGSASAAGKVEGRRLFVAVGGVVLENHAGSDFLSSPDIYVRVQRRDPVILSEIDDLDDRLSDLRSEHKIVKDELRLLRAKKKASEIEPGKPMSHARTKRLAELSADLGGSCDEPASKTRCRDCGRYDERPFCSRCEACNELQFLLERKAGSEIAPRPPLTGPEERRLTELAEREKNLSDDIDRDRNRRRELYQSITGRTETITTPGYTLDYGFGPVQEVFPGDEVWVSVYDEDLDADDLYGSTAFRVGEDMLSGEDRTLSMPNVRSAVVRIVSQ